MLSFYDGSECSSSIMDQCPVGVGSYMNNMIINKCMKTFFYFSFQIVGQNGIYIFCDDIVAFPRLLFNLKASEVFIVSGICHLSATLQRTCLYSVYHFSLESSSETKITVTHLKSLGFQERRTCFLRRPNNIFTYPKREQNQACFLRRTNNIVTYPQLSLSQKILVTYPKENRTKCHVRISSPSTWRLGCLPHQLCWILLIFLLP